MLRHRPLLPDELVVYRKELIARFARDKVRAEGASDSEARQEAIRSWERARARTDGEQLIWRLELGDKLVGTLWLHHRSEWGVPTLWVYDLLLRKTFRGQGLGRQAMHIVEAEAERRGLTSIGLHVFGHNTVARELYRSLGYRPTSLVLRKEFPAI